MGLKQHSDDASVHALRIDVDAVFRKKGKGIYPFIPKFLIRYLERVVHQDEINDALPRLAHLEGLDFIEEVLKSELGILVDIVNPENIPGEGRFIVVSNHPLGGLDGMALMHVIGQKRRDLQFVSNDILMELKPIASLFAPVNKHGRNTREYVMLLDALYAGDQVVLVFPAGLVSRRSKGRIADLEWKKSFVAKAIQHKRDIVPVYIEGRNSDFFYNLANWRKRLGIKANIEMLYLADELFMQKNQTIRMHFGRPVSWRSFTGDLSHLQWAQQLKAHVYKLAQGDLVFQKEQL
jgi:putative hemolysin